MKLPLPSIPTRAAASVLLASAAAGLGASPAQADDKPVRAFAHVGSFDVRDNGSTAAEIVAASADGATLVYTDSPGDAVGFVDIVDPSAPLADGTLAVGGEPTSVAVAGPYALIAVNTSTSFTTPSGKLVVIRLATRTVERELPLAGQPDSVKVSPDGKYAAIVIENERDEDVNDGFIPQAPAGALSVLTLSGRPSAWTLRNVDLTGIAGYAASDPEPEYVDINRKNLAVVSLQENNHLAIVDLKTARVLNHFAAGSVRLEGVDATEEKLGPQRKGDIQLSETIERRREPDTVAWIDDDTFATANEGDYEDDAGVEGGARGFTLFNLDGRVEYESYASFEHAAIRVGHYDEARSANKGVEPEALASDRFGGDPLLFVGAERANALGVYDVSGCTPELLQVLPTGIGPEGIATLPKRDLVAVASETAASAVPSLITLYERRRGLPTVQLESANDAAGRPIPWVAMSGLAADPLDRSTLYGVSDSILGKGYIYPIDVSARNPVIVDRIEVQGASFSLDLEGITARRGGGYWLASEGRIASGKVDRPDALVRVDEAGQVLEEVLLPDALRAGATSSGFEGVAVVQPKRGPELVYAVIQREWADDAPGLVKIGRYDTRSQTWSFVRYALDAVSLPTGGWVGLSEITLLPSGKFAIVERDNQLGDDAQVKRVYTVDLAGAEFRPFGDARGLVTVRKSLLADLRDALREGGILTPDKLEGFAVAKGGRAYAVTDNDGLDAALGDTVWLELGKLEL